MFDCTDVPNQQEDIDEFIEQVRHAFECILVTYVHSSKLLSWYEASVKAKNAEIAASTTLLKEKDERLKEKDAQLTKTEKLLGERVKDKDREMDERLKEKDREMDERLKEKDKQIDRLQEESKDVLGTLKDVARKDRVKDRIWSGFYSFFFNFCLRYRIGTITRSQAWHSLESKDGVKVLGELSNQQHDKKASLISEFEKLSMDKWKEEKNMYPHIIKAVRTGFYTDSSGPKVVDTHDSKDFRADVSISDYADGKVAYCLWYFIELKFVKVELFTADHCGQMLDYFHEAHERQPHRREFVGILSNFISAWVFTARYHGGSVTVSQQHAGSLADAIIYADGESRVQYTR
jgi:hypothetical protein